MVDAVRERNERKMRELKERFTVEIEEWIGPDVSNPDETYAKLNEARKPPRRVWQLFMYKRGDEDSWESDATDPNLPAKFEFTDAELEAIPVLDLATRLAVAVANRETHEVFEHTNLDGQQLINPHSRASVARVANLIAAMLVESATDD